MTPRLERKPSRDELAFHPSMPANSPPPYYEADAYPKQRIWRRRRSPLALALILTVAFMGPLFLLSMPSRETLLQSSAEAATAPVQGSRFQASLAQCAALKVQAVREDPASRTSNPRWNAVSGQTEAVVLRNAKLFDGEKFATGLVDIVFEKGLIISVSEAGSKRHPLASTAREFNVHGQWVTPGIVDMHSHHGVMPWPESEERADGNEMHPDFGPLTPFVRALDGIKAYDEATTAIGSGGVTTSLVIPGSANIMGGEGTVLKNRLRSGPHGEQVVEELLLEHGIPLEQRHRYMKMACGENPKRVYGHTRMGNTWVLRKHLARAKELLEKQDAWCAAAAELQSSNIQVQNRFLQQMGGGFPEDLELESTVGMLRGRVAMHNHCYEPEDMETMLRTSKEFGFRIRAFHHAIVAWRVPEMLKEYGQNVTIATFAEFGLYKWEAYDASLYAGKILSEHGVPLAYKSDSIDAHHLLNQAAAGHSFGVPAEIALQSVTSVPAKAIDLDYRVGYARPGYDADLVVWDSYPLSIGATPRQVFIDGVAILDPKKVEESIDRPFLQSGATRGAATAEEPKMRPVVAESDKQSFCGVANRKGQSFVIHGIRGSFLEHYPELAVTPGVLNDHDNLTLVISEGKVDCLGSSGTCSSQVAAAQRSGASMLTLSNGFLAPGLTAVTGTLGLSEIYLGEGTGNGAISPVLDPNDNENFDVAVYGIELGGKLFDRARIGGITRAITPPLSNGGLVRGFSTAFLTSDKRSILDGAIYQPFVGLHVHFGQLARVGFGSGSYAIRKLRLLLGIDGLTSSGIKDKAKEEMLASVIKGERPFVLHADSLHDIQQIILLNRDLEKDGQLRFIKLIIYGGHEASYVADELAAANIPVILNGHRGTPSQWDTRRTLIGPPLSRSPASILAEAGVLFALAADGPVPEGDTRIHALSLEASWAAKYAGLSDQEAIRLVSRNVEEILNLPPTRDIVVWEGSPLQYGGRVQLALQEVDGLLEIATCYPDEGDGQ